MSVSTVQPCQVHRETLREGEGGADPEADFEGAAGLLVRQTFSERCDAFLQALQRALECDVLVLLVHDQSPDFDSCSLSSMQGQIQRWLQVVSIRLFNGQVVPFRTLHLRSVSLLFMLLHLGAKPAATAAPRSKPRSDSD